MGVRGWGKMATERAEDLQGMTPGAKSVHLASARNHKTINSLTDEQKKDVKNIYKDMIPLVFMIIPLQIHLMYRTYGDVDSWLDIAGPLLAAALFTEPASGFLHIVLDNPKFNDYPLIGPECQGFQRHHITPAEIATRPTWKFFLEVTAPYLVVGLQGLYLPSF